MIFAEQHAEIAKSASKELALHIANTVALLLIALLHAGCVWRAGGVEHYLGPVWFEYTAPPEGNAYVWVGRHFPIAIEAGRQWGLNIISLHRTAAFPQNLNEPRNESMKWTYWGLPFVMHEIQPHSRVFSFLYLKGERIPTPEFIARTTLGVAIGAGTEARSLSIGWAATTEFIPRTDAYYVLSYRSDHPLETDFSVSTREDLFIKRLERR